MSVDIIKNISINSDKRTISVTSAANNVTPRHYETWYPLKGGHFTFDTWLEALASDCFNGSAQFLPSCESKAHEAYLYACEKMGGDWRYAYNRFGAIDGPEYDAFREGWRRVFLDFLLAGERDTRKFVMSCNGRPVNLSVRRGRYGDLTGSYRYTTAPKPVSWIRKTVITREFSKFVATEV